MALFVLLAACGRDGTSNKGDGSVPSDVVLDLPSVAVSLSCREPVEQAGSCARDADCEGDALCVADTQAAHADRSPMPLVCGKALGKGKARARCAEAQDCESGVCGLSGVCLSPCAETGDCPRGQICMPVEARWEDGLEPIQACARVFAFSDDVKLTRRPRAESRADEISTLHTGTTMGDAVVFLKAGCGAEAEVREIRASASNAVLFNFDALYLGSGTPNPVVNTGGFLPMLLPNNPAIDDSPQGYALDVHFDRAGAVETVTAVRTGERAILDLNVFLVGGGEEAGPTGLHPGSEELAGLMERLDARFKQAGITLGQIREHDVPGALRDELGVIETRPIRDSQGNLVDLSINGIDKLFELSAGLDDGGVNLFLVRDMGDLLGISGGVPGAIGVHGTALSGVAVAVDTVGLDRLDAVILHEIGHQLGLFHTSELNGFVIEPLSDTKACGLNRDLDEDSVLSPGECRDAGANNLMFWAGTGSELSPQQSEILRRSPVLR